MPSIDVMKTDGTKSSLELPAVFATPLKEAVLHQAIVAYLANARQSNAHTKTRGEVSGGGRKPWKQKGTGRARAGSSRSPIWTGGGITFGPRSDANHTKRLPVKIKRLALAMALSSKLEANQILVADLTVQEPKTKQVAALVKGLAPLATSVLLVTATYDATLLQAASNLPNVAVIMASDLNAYDVLNFETIIMNEAAIASIEQLAQPKKLKSEKQEK